MAGEKWAPPGHRLKELVGQGGMGTLYRGVDTSLGRTVAIKVLPLAYAQDHNFVKRFQREARAAAALSHPRIVTVYATGFHEGRHYIIMEFVEGRSLWEALEKEGAFEFDRALELVTQVADGLAEAHSKGLIHRDIKPHNLLLKRDGSVKIADFGLVHTVKELSDLTVDGSRLGTPRYMSPETCEGHPTSLQTDIYSLGVVFYELLAGEAAFMGESSLAIMRQIVDGEFPDILAIRPDTPVEFVKVIAMLSAKNPDDRYENCSDLLVDLRACASGEPLPFAGAVRAGGSDTPPPPSAGIGIAPLPPLADAGLPESFAMGELPPLKITAKVARQRVTPDSAQPERVRPQLAEGAAHFVVHYIKADESWAEWVAKKLKGARYGVETLEWDVSVKHESLRDLLKHAEQGSVVVSVISPSYIGSIHGHSEWVQALYTNLFEVFPVMVRKSDVANVFKSFHYIDLTELDHRRSEDVLLAEARERFGDPGEAAPHAQEKPAIVPTAEMLTGGHRGVFRVPRAAEANFTGRDKVMADLFAHLKKSQGAIVIGDPPLDGLGVSQIAVEYANLNKFNYDIVWWIDASNPASLLNDFVALGGALGLSSANAQKIPTTIQAVRGSLAELDGWLVIMDGVRSSAEVARYIPGQRRGHVIITTSSPAVAQGDYPVLRVPALEREKSIQFVFRSTGERNEGAGASLAQALADLPIALKLASSFIKTSECGTDAYLDRFLDRYRQFAGGQGARRDPALIIQAAVSVAAERLASLDKPALELAKFAAYLDNEGIELSQLTLMPKFMSRSLSRMLADGRKRQAAFADLNGLGLLENDGSIFRMPTPVQNAFRAWLEADLKTVEAEGLADFLEDFRFGGDKRSATFWCEAAVEALNALFPEDPDDVKMWPECDRLLRHAHTTLRQADRLGVKAETCAALWSRVGEYYQVRAMMEFATGAFRRAVKLLEKAKGPRHHGLAPLYGQLARVCRFRGKLDEAHDNYEQALALLQKNRSKDYGKIAEVYAGLGDVAMEQRDLPSARQHYLRALEEDRKMKGEETKESAGRDYMQLGLVSQELGDLTASWDYYNKALEIFEHVYEEYDGQVAAAVKNMAGLLQIMGDLDNARNYYRRALKIDLYLHDEHHPFVARDRNNLGLVLQDLGFLDEALVELKKALEIDEANYGANHAKVALNKNNVGNVLHAQGKLREALRYYRQAAETFQNVLGDYHEHTETALRNFRRVRDQIEKRQDKSGPKALG